jgi:quercetin dioxygenase-like cupin family protein
MRSRGSEVIELRPGEVVWTPPGEEHWHGAAPGAFMTHPAIWGASEGGGEESTWGQHVTDAEYGHH